MSQLRKQQIIFLAPREEKKYQYVKCFISLSLSFPMHPTLSWKLKIIAYRGISTIPTSFKLERFCQDEMTSIVTKSSIVDNLGTKIRLWFVCFLCKLLPKRLKLNKVDIYMFKLRTTVNK